MGAHYGDILVVPEAGATFRSDHLPACAIKARDLGSDADYINDPHVGPGGYLARRQTVSTRLSARGRCPSFLVSAKRTSGGQSEILGVITTSL